MPENECTCVAMHMPGLASVSGTVSVCTGRALRTSHNNTSDADSPGQASKSSTASAAMDGVLADTAPIGANGRAAAKLVLSAETGRAVDGGGDAGDAAAECSGVCA